MTLLLLFHIVVALATLAVVTTAYFKPSTNSLKVNYLSASLTFVSGTILTILNPSHLVQACLTGIVYFTIVTVVTLLARRKLVALATV